MTTADPPAERALRSRLLAILAADVAGYSRLMSIDERATVAALDAARAVFRRHIGQHGGRIIDMAGDAVLAVFDTATGAVDAALTVQRQIAGRHGDTPEPRRLRFRIGVHVGDVIEKDDGSVYGDGVNIAARLEALAAPGSLAVSHEVHGMVARRVDAAFDDLGEQAVKNIAQTVRVWRLRNAGFRFGDFELRAAERWLLARGEPVALSARAMDLLLALAAQPGQLIARQTLLERVWPDVPLPDADLAEQVGLLRELFGSDVLTTVPGRGYSFTPPADAAHATASPAPAAALPATLRTNLPAELPPLLGRADELAALGALIEQHRLVSIVGAGGIGKTRLAQALLDAHRDAYPHGVCWIEMASIADAALVPGRIAAALGVALGGGDPAAGLLAALAPLGLLAVLDNAEQVLAEVSRLAGELHDAAPGLHLVVTSQAPLRLAIERVYRIDALAVPQGPLPAALALQFGAVALFTERAQAADARFALTDANAPQVIAICRALDGLPLAIELAAARAPMLGVQRLAASMQNRLKLLTANRNRAAPARQQTLRATLEWSHGFLDARERAVYRRLAVMAGSASLELIQQVVADPADAPAGDSAGALDDWAVLDALSVLVDRSLVVVLGMDDAAAPRYLLLDSPRLFALEQLQAAGEAPALRRRHALALAALFDAQWDEAFGDRLGEDAWQRAMAADLDNAREALACAEAAGDAATALAIAPTLLRALPGALHAERMALAERCALLAEKPAPLRLQQRAWMQIGGQWTNAHKQRGHGAAQRALALARELHAASPDAGLLYLALARLARCAAGVGALDEARAALTELQTLENPDWPAQRLISATEARSVIAAFQGDAAEALRHTRRRVALDRARGAAGYTGLAILVDRELAAGDAVAAARTGTDLIAALAGTREEYPLAFGRLNLAAAWLALDEREQARAIALAGWPHAARFDQQRYWADYLALLAALDGRAQAAARLAGYADCGYTAREELRQPNEAAAAARARALASAALGDADYLRLHEEGKALRDADIAALAFADNSA